MTAMCDRGISLARRVLLAFSGDKFMIRILSSALFGSTGTSVIVRNRNESAMNVLAELFTPQHLYAPPQDVGFMVRDWTGA